MKKHAKTLTPKFLHAFYVHQCLYECFAIRTLSHTTRGRHPLMMTREVSSNALFTWSCKITVSDVREHGHWILLLPNG